MCCAIRFIVASALLLTTLPSYAAIYRVGAGAGCTHNALQAAINDAADSPENDEILVSQNQSYTQQALLIDMAQGVLRITGGYANCEASAPTPAARVQLDGNRTQPVIRILDSLNNLTVIINNFDIVDGGGSKGGGVWVVGSDGDVLALNNTQVRQNQAQTGGGIAVQNAQVNGNPDGMVLLLDAASSVVSNSASNGGGIHCSDASVSIYATTYVALNAASESGGGIYAEDCHLNLISTGYNANGAVLWGNNALGSGGGLYLTGTASTGNVSSYSAETPARITGNSAAYGGGMAIADDAKMVLFDAIVEQNTASVGGGGAFVVSGRTALNLTLLRMSGVGANAPPYAAACAEPEACNRIQGNSAFLGSAVYVSATRSLAAHVEFQGTRLEANTGNSLTYHASTSGQVQFNGALVVRNESDSELFDAPGSANSLVMKNSTVANNQIGRPAVIYGAGGCNPPDDQAGTTLSHSIIWQPGHTLLQATSTIDANCFRSLIAADFGTLPASMDRVVANPLFADVVSGNFRLADNSPALDFAQYSGSAATRDGGARLVDLPEVVNYLGPQDLGAYEKFNDVIFVDDFDLP